MDNAEPQMISDLRHAGFNPAAAHDVDHYLYFPSPVAANHAADALRSTGFDVKVKPGASRTFLLLARHRITPAEVDTDALLRHWNNFAAQHGAEYDGWEAAPAAE